jgi:hypothetical protein
MPKQHRRNQSSGQFYFVTHNPGHSESVREAGDDVAVIEPKLSGAAEEEFKPKPVNRNLVSGCEWAVPIRESRTERNILPYWEQYIKIRSARFAGYGFSERCATVTLFSI